VRELVQLFVKNLERKKHIFELINHVKLVLTIESDWESYSIFITNGVVSMSPTTIEKNSAKVKIQGNTEAISSLLNGSLKLREGANRDELHIVGSFRQILLLESVFYLAGKSVVNIF
jgi:hypothetical protein